MPFPTKEILVSRKRIRKKHNISGVSENLMCAPNHFPPEPSNPCTRWGHTNEQNHCLESELCSVNLLLVPCWHYSSGQDVIASIDKKCSVKTLQSKVTIPKGAERKHGHLHIADEELKHRKAAGRGTRGRGSTVVLLQSWPFLLHDKAELFQKAE